MRSSQRATSPSQPSGQKSSPTSQHHQLAHPQTPKMLSVRLIPIPFTSQLTSIGYLLIIDSLNPLSSTHPQHLATFLSSLLLSPQISLLATYHTDIPLLHTLSPYQPNPLTTLIYLATAILSISSLSQVLARKRARDRSLQPPLFGLQEEREGVIVGLKGNGRNSDSGRGVVVGMEIRRRSGRGVMEDFVLIPQTPSSSSSSSTPTNIKISHLSDIILLDEHPLYASIPSNLSGSQEETGADEAETTFSLSLTEKQKADRENVVLPYFDAQREGGALGAGEGGRILYDMGSEDKEDFDDDEDEI